MIGDPGLNDLCDGIQQIMQEMDEKMQGAIKRQEENYILAFRKARDKIIQELRQIQETFNLFVNESQNDEAKSYLQNQLIFFREQAHQLNHMKKLLLDDNVQLKNQNQILQEEKNEQKTVLHRLQDENMKLKSTISKLREQKIIIKGQNLIDSTVQTVNKSVEKTATTKDYQSYSRNILTPITSYSYRQQRLAKLGTISKERLQSETVQEDSVEKQNPNNAPIRIIRRPTPPKIEAQLGDFELRKLFKDCTKTLFQEIQIRKLQQKVKKKPDELQRNSLNENKLIEEDNSFLKVTKQDQKLLMERFFSSTRFLEIVEAQIFNVRCCTNSNCLYNFRGLQKDTSGILEASQGHTLLHQLNESVQSRRESIDNKSKWMNKDIRKIQLSQLKLKDQKLEYQQCLGEIKQLERDLLTVSKKDKLKIVKMNNKMLSLNERLVDLSRLIKTKDRGNDIFLL